MTKKPRRPGTRAGTQSGRRVETVGPYDRVEISKPAPPAKASRKPSLGDFPSAAVAALDDLIAAAEARDDNDPLTAPAAPLVPDDLEFAPIDSVDMPLAPSKPKQRAITNAVPDDHELVEETVLPVLPTLRFAVLEEAAHLEAAESAISAAGHDVIVGASGREGVESICEAIRRDDVDAVLVVLPGGEAIIDAALALEPRRPVLIASVADTAVQAVHRATTAGADLATTKPHDVDRVAPILLAAARLFHERNLALNVRGSEQVLRARLDEIADTETRGLESFEMFQRVLEREIKRARRYEYPLAVALFAVEIPPPPPPPGIRGILRARAGNALINTIRDIDLATQLDHERFLVLLPYTDLSGAALLARRVIASVASGDPVVSAGRSFPPRVVGAVAGASEGEISFARLMKDATRALEQARRDGAELAVQP
ncbi:MAG: diguanylate cyclase [Myxococcales bacterium]|nr:diguanylate cyclase [Myxococcales bacterium]